MRIQTDIDLTVFYGNVVTARNVQSRFAICFLLSVKRDLCIFNQQLMPILSIKHKHACPSTAPKEDKMATPNAVNRIRDDQLLVFD